MQKNAVFDSSGEDLKRDTIHFKTLIPKLGYNRFDGISFQSGDGIFTSSADRAVLRPVINDYNL
jgi:hypothetical protein